VREGAYDADSFNRFIRDLMPYMNPWPQPRSVLVMDNCSIHHGPEVAALCAERYVSFHALFFVLKAKPCYSGVRLYYLPPYSPDLNPIEESFAYLKAYLRRNGSSFRHAVDSKNAASILLFLHTALASISPTHAQGWMTHSGYL
jgi:transposase